MSERDPDPRAEAARIVAAARRWIERERAAGLDESALSAASKGEVPGSRGSTAASRAACSVAITSLCMGTLKRYPRRRAQRPDPPPVTRCFTLWSTQVSAIEALLTLG